MLIVTHFANVPLFFVHSISISKNVFTVLARNFPNKLWTNLKYSVVHSKTIDMPNRIDRILPIIGHYWHILPIIGPYDKYCALIWSLRNSWEPVVLGAYWRWLKLWLSGDFYFILISFLFDRIKSMRFCLDCCCFCWCHRRRCCCCCILCVYTFAYNKRWKWRHIAYYWPNAKWSRRTTQNQHTHCRHYLSPIDSQPLKCDSIKMCARIKLDIIKK